MKEDNMERWDLRSREQAFFGTISAGISHDINNIFAGVQENAGIIKDMTGLMNMDDTSRLEKINVYCDRLMQQTQKGVQLMKRFNRFAHSVDEQHTLFNAREYLEDFAQLFSRFAMLKSVRIEMKLPEDTLSIHGCPYDFLHMVFICFSACLEYMEQNGHLTLSATVQKSVLEIRISGEPIVSGDDINREMVLLNNLAEKMNGRVAFEYIPTTEKAEFALSFPHDFQTAE